VVASDFREFLEPFDNFEAAFLPGSTIFASADPALVSYLLLMPPLIGVDDLHCLFPELNSFIDFCKFKYL